MPERDMSRWRHDHVFDAGNDLAERSTWGVMWITALTMVVEIAAGWWFNSMALLADVADCRVGDFTARPTSGPPPRRNRR